MRNAKLEVKLVLIGQKKIGFIFSEFVAGSGGQDKVQRRQQKFGPSSIFYLTLLRSVKL